jgi:hypothetical protein
MLESAFSILAVDVDPPAVTLIPLGDPWIRDLRWASGRLRLVLAVVTLRLLVVVGHLEEI